MSDFGGKSKQIKNILSNFEASIQQNHVSEKSLRSGRRSRHFGRQSVRPENPRRGRLRNPIRQPRIRQQRLQRIADALQRPPHPAHRRRVAGEEPAGRRRRDDAELRPVQPPGRPLPERRQAADVLPIQDRKRPGQCRYLQPQGAHGRLLDGLLQRLDPLLPQPPLGIPRTLRLVAAREDLRRDGHRLGGDVLRGFARDVPHPLGRPLHHPPGILRRICLLDVPLRRFEAQRERHGQPAAEPLHWLGVQRLFRLRHPGRSALRPAARPQCRPRLAQTLRRSVGRHHLALRCATTWPIP